MPVTQMNLRIDAQVKERGDTGLAQAGYSPSRAVRTLWEFAAAHVHDPRTVQDLLQQVEMRQDADEQSRIAAKMAVLDEALGLQRQLEALTGLQQGAEVREISDRELRAEALFSRWEERGLA